MDHHEMRLIPLGDRVPHVDPSAWIADTATVVGDVTIGPGTGIFYSAVLRADMESVTVGAGSNIQDGAVLHADPGFPARIGDDVSVGHGAVLHGCTVEAGCLIGMNATVLNGAVVGAGSLVAANALVPEGTVIPPGSLVAGVPGKVRRELTDAEVESCRANAAVYRQLAETHRAATGRAAP
jgi:carbonic anhydrase/acetyltransferase-like protein (isoleucine patch superfamily)